MSRKARRVGELQVSSAPPPRAAPAPRPAIEPAVSTADKIERDVGGALSAIWNVISADCPEQVLAKEIAKKFRK